MKYLPIALLAICLANQAIATCPQICALQYAPCKNHDRCCSKDCEKANPSDKFGVCAPCGLKDQQCCSMDNPNQELYDGCITNLACKGGRCKPSREDPVEPCGNKREMCCEPDADRDYDGCNDDLVCDGDRKCNPPKEDPVEPCGNKREMCCEPDTDRDYDGCNDDLVCDRDSKCNPPKDDPVEPCGNEKEKCCEPDEEEKFDGCYDDLTCGRNKKCTPPRPRETCDDKGGKCVRSCRNDCKSVCDRLKIPYLKEEQCTAAEEVEGDKLCDDGQTCCIAKEKPKETCEDKGGSCVDDCKSECKKVCGWNGVSYSQYSCKKVEEVKGEGLCSNHQVCCKPEKKCQPWWHPKCKNKD